MTSPSRNLPYLVSNREQLSMREFIDFLGTHDSFAFNLTSRAGPDLDAGLRRFHLLIGPIIKRWSQTQNKTFTGSESD
jgi:hypothetical protein